MPLRVLATLFTVTVLSQHTVAELTSTSSPDFNREIRPILSDHCFACHGPDGNDRQAELRLDSDSGLQRVLSKKESENSLLVERVNSDDPNLVMPPPEFQKPLSAEQRQIIERWIKAGAKIDQPWAFTNPSKKELPPSITNGQQAIDHAIKKRLAEVGLQQNSRANPSELLRQVCLDLTGLPPSVEQMDLFLENPSPQAYEQLVDDLLASSHFGEHFGRHWLDLVRYGDTHGLHLDNYREMWPYRDWVIEAFNSNLPFDQFISQQLAGDLIDGAGEKGLIASGFNRLNVTTNEGGSIYDEVFVRNVIDRTDAFGTIFLGLTVGCAVCHDHKFDPISQRDYYSLSAFFNSLDGKAMDGNTKDPAPVIRVATEEQKNLITEYQLAISDFQKEMQGPIDTIDQAQRRWEKHLTDETEGIRKDLIPEAVISSAEAEMEILEDGSVKITGNPGVKDTTTITASLPSGGNWRTLHLEALTDSEEAKVGVSANGNVVLTEITLEVGNPEANDPWIKLPMLHAIADIEQSDGPFGIRFAIDSSLNDREGWAVGGHQQPGGRNAWFTFPPIIAENQNQKIRIQLQYQSVFAKHQFKQIRFSLSDSGPTIPENQKITLGPLFSAGPFPIESPNPGYSRKFASQQESFDKEQVFRYEDVDYPWEPRNSYTEVTVNSLPAIQDRSSALILYQAIQSPKAQKVKLLFGTDDGSLIYLNGKEISNRRGPQDLSPLDQQIELDLKAGQNDLYWKIINHDADSFLTFAYRSPAIPIPATLTSLVRTPPEERDKEVQTALRKYYRTVHCLHPDWLALLDLEKGTRRAKESLEKQIATTLVWKETQEPRASHVLLRGQYDQPGETVERDTPDFLPTFPESSPKDRLGLAHWLTGNQHPLTARVAVNRFWQQLFGTGLVKTSEDFGNQGAPPSHPALLDWLSTDFRENGWNVKQLIRSMVTSNAYCASHNVTPTMQSIDPYNRLLARGPRHRLDAEVLRDQALFLSGLMVDQRGGPSVKPPQPEGLWAAVGYSGSNTVRFSQDQGEKLYRRSVYTFWKRTSPPPQMSMLDAPSRESCTARRERTNTPLQALLLLNEQQYIEAAKKLAQRIQQECPESTNEAKVHWVFKIATAREPSEKEVNAMMSLLNDSERYYREQNELREEFVGTGSVMDAAWALLCNTILNLDEVVSK
ncbi:PSD1 and planctomycete cytochrome C domain-containing protein [bacterium]|nr:PSD1 and planctomycete cytochrome C domain-containing protein [Rhodopirellula sp.]MDB4679090.1 PSD1 and planctomycete cytochrome C domain-containing protein [Rhodopirellula sp.]MDC0278831.1 PSD1 and planctomycete cytochrome C domain-containing protein [bacterium]